MGKPASKGDYCARCGRPVAEVGRLSSRNICVPCGAGAVVENARQLSEHAGPYYERHLAGRAREAVRRAREAGVPVQV